MVRDIPTQTTHMGWTKILLREVSTVCSCKPIWICKTSKNAAEKMSKHPRRVVKNSQIPDIIK